MLTWLIKKDEMINSGTLPVIVGCGYLAYELIRSISVLVQYGRQVKELENE